MCVQQTISLFRILLKNYKTAQTIAILLSLKALKIHGGIAQLGERLTGSQYVIFIKIEYIVGHWRSGSASHWQCGGLVTFESVV